MSAPSRTAFISGPLDATEAYFNSYYVPRINTAIVSGHSFCIGPVRGVDRLALHYLLSQAIEPFRITVYMASFEYQQANWRSEFEDLGVTIKEVQDAATTRDRDAAMTAASDYDILSYRTEAEAKELYGSLWWPRVSNTEMNERRRLGIASQAYDMGVRHVRS